MTDIALSRIDPNLPVTPYDTLILGKYLAKDCEFYSCLLDVGRVLT